MLTPLQIYLMVTVFYGQPSNLKAAFDFLEERLKNNESIVFFAEIDAKVVGFTQLYPIFSSVGLQRAWLLNDLFVLPAARKQGVGAALLNAAKDFGVVTNSRYILLETAADNLIAQKLYEANGWEKPTGYFYQYKL